MQWQLRILLLKKTLITHEVHTEKSLKKVLASNNLDLVVIFMSQTRGTPPSIVY